MNWRGVVFLSCCFILTVLFLSVAHYSDALPFLVDYLPASVGSGGLLWQVQTTFLSVGFAGLAIAAQLFVEAPLAIGASRGRVLDYIWAGWFVGVGLAANSAIAIETIWLPSEVGLLGLMFTWFALTIVLLVLSTVRLTRLFGHPSLLDAVVRQSLVETISSRLLEVSSRYAGATKGLESLLAPTGEMGAPRGWTLRVQVSEAGRIVRAVRPKAVRQALAAMAPRATALASTEGEGATEYVPPQITLDIDPGDRVRPGDIAFRVTTSREIDEMTGARVSQLLQSSIEFEPTFGALPPADSQDRASEYNRFLRVLAEKDRDLTPQENDLQGALQEQIAKWNESEAAGLAAEPLSEARIEVIRASLRDGLNQQINLATLIPVADAASDSADTSRPILGMNLQVPREFLVDKVFNGTCADPTGFGEIIARGFTDGEDQRAIDVLRSLQTEILNPEAAVIRQSIHALGDDAEHYVLLTPFGGLDDLADWYSSDFRRDLEVVTHVETGMLDNEAILFDRRSSLSSIRRPEDKDGLSRVEGTSIALGVFEDVDDDLEPQVRVEAGEYFVVWAGAAPRVVRFVAA
ncbi:hypothetical protein R8Z57_07495 [Microbacterium sp. M3]|uniref:Uncharacterized protein n=1 Tax=Microbacterium arthrosphaerae TaxID=792652 RepID=A0ABU4GZY3_9MICO|nr:MULTISPECIES: hypothetical protein [Microbacterium]MDW4572619.1 hypothetical protein [Microbacterium arthrosphaerae]MDW7606474.1 hypothetical protein [Microbacterium sp. M3]